MSPPKTIPYGSWKSPITSDLIVAQSVALAGVRFDGDYVYWLEGRPQEQGRLVVVRADWHGGNATDMTRKPYSARTNTAVAHGRCREASSTSPTSATDACTAAAKPRPTRKP